MRVTDQNGCSASDTVVVRSSVGIEDIEAFPGMVSLYPNPVADILHITKLELYNSLYELLWHSDEGETEYIQRDLNVQRYTPGMYILRITLGKRIFASKILIVRN